MLVEEAEELLLVEDAGSEDQGAQACVVLVEEEEGLLEDEDAGSDDHGPQATVVLADDAEELLMDDDAGSEGQETHGCAVVEELTRLDLGSAHESPWV